MNRNLAIVTPAKNEEENIPNLVDGVFNQSQLPKLWVFVNDASTDNTVEVFNKEIQSRLLVHTDIKIVIVNYEDHEKGYALGEKYSRIIKFALSNVYKEEVDSKFQYIGILDCDVIPEKNYYRGLINNFENDSNLGIASAGKLNENIDGVWVTTFVNKSFAAGGFRVWKRDCLEQTGYHVSVSQDSVSAARAVMMGWKVRSYRDLSVNIRQRGAKYGYAYYGKSAYMRHVPFFYLLAGAFKLFASGKRKDSFEYINGYRKASKDNVVRIKDPLAIKYFKYRLFYKILGK